MKKYIWEKNSSTFENSQETEIIVEYEAKFIKNNIEGMHSFP